MRNFKTVLMGSLTVVGLVSGVGMAAPHAKLTAGKASSIAIAKYPGTVVGSPKLENEENGWEYSVLVRSGKQLREVMVNANTGSIASVETCPRLRPTRKWLSWYRP
jgi:uncharacterized membrane protein YkoI